MSRFMLAAIALLLAARTEAATVLILSSPAGAEVKIDDKVVGKTPMRTSLQWGSHSLELSRAGCETHKEVLEVTSDKLVRREITLAARRYPVDIVFKDPAETGWYVADDRLKRLLWEGGAFVTAPSTIRLPKGTHALRLAKGGYRDVAVRVTVSTDKPNLVEVAAVPKKGPSNLSLLRRVFVSGSHKRHDGATCVLKTDGTYTYHGGAGGTWEVVEEGGKVYVDFKTNRTHRWVFRHTESGNCSETLPWVLESHNRISCVNNQYLCRQEK
jgi:hypothetical protein